MANLRVGIAGLGTAAQMVLPVFAGVPGVTLAGAADVRAEARDAFAGKYKLPVFESVEALCRSDIDAVWIETPNHLHSEHALTAARNGKHIICAKPLAATLAECDVMIAAAHKAGVRLLIGHSKIFDSPIRAMAEIARSGRLGRLVQIECLLHNDWLRRPRLPEELEEAKGAGFVLRQVPHLVDIAGYIAGSPATSVRATATEASCTALIQYENGATASVSLNGSGYFDSSELTFGIGTLGEKHDPAKPRVHATEKYAARPERKIEAMPFFGLTIVSCEKGAIRQSPGGLYVYTDAGREEVPVAPHLGRAAELIELRDALKENRDVFPNGPWGKANLEICLAMLRSSREGADVKLR